MNARSEIEEGSRSDRQYSTHIMTTAEKWQGPVIDTNGDDDGAEKKEQRRNREGDDRRRSEVFLGGAEGR